MTELYIMQRYLRPSLLQNAGLQTFDDWASNFGEVVSKAELKPAGNGYRTKKRFAKFNNVPELMQMFKEFADIRTPDMLNLPVPQLEGGKPQIIVAKPNDEQQAMLKRRSSVTRCMHSSVRVQSVSFLPQPLKWERAQIFRQSWRLCTIWIYRGNPLMLTCSNGTFH